MDWGDGGENKKDYDFEHVHSFLCFVFWFLFFFSIPTCLSPNDGFQIIMIITVGINFLYDYIVTI